MPLPQWLFPRTRAFFYGLTLPWTAFRVIVAHPVLIVWSVIPVAITLGVYFYLISWLETATTQAVTQYFIVAGWRPEGWLATLALILTRLILFFVAALTFSVSSSIIASPFNDWLAECTERRAMPPLPPAQAVSLGARARLILIDVMKSLAALVAGIAAILLSWIPLINFIAMLVAFLLLTFQYTSYPQTRRGEGLREGLRFLWTHLFSCLGLGATLSVAFAIPIFSSFFLPLAVVSGTLLYARAQAPASRDIPKLV